MVDIPLTPINPNGSKVAAGNASTFGGAVAVMIILICHMRGTDFPAGAESAIAVIISTSFVYVRAILGKWTGVNLP